MEKSLLIRVIRSFSKKEIRELNKWVHSPAHNQREDVIKLFTYLTEEKHLQDTKYLKKDKAFYFVFPNESYDDAKIRQTMHFLMKVVEEYLVFKQTVEEEAQVRIALAKEYRKRNLDKPFLKSLKGAERAQKKQSYRNEHYYRNEYLIQQEHYRFLSEQKRTSDLNLQEVSNALDTTYLADKLRQSCHMLSHKAVREKEYEMGLIEELLNYIQRKELLNIPAIAIYYYIYKALMERSEESHYFHLKKEIFEHGNLFPESEIREIALMAINYCIGQLNSGKKSFIRESFELYKKGLEDGFLIEDGKITRFTFRNAVAIALMEKEYDWVESFIEKYQYYLDEKYRESFVSFNTAILEFDRGNYDKVQAILSRVDFKDILMNLNAKRMMIKIFYEQDEFDVLESYLESMRNYMRRKKVMGYHKSNATNIIRLTKKLLRVNPFDDEQKKKLTEEITTAKPLFHGDREWLLKRLEEL